MASGSGPPSFTPPWPFLVLCSWPIASILVVNSPKKLRLARHSLALSESVKFYRVRPRLESSLRWIGEKDGITRLSAANRANCWSNVFKRSGDTRHAWPHTFGSQFCLLGNLGWNISDLFLLTNPYFFTLIWKWYIYHSFHNHSANGQEASYPHLLCTWQIKVMDVCFSAFVVSHYKKYLLVSHYKINNAP